MINSLTRDFRFIYSRVWQSTMDPGYRFHVKKPLVLSFRSSVIIIS